VGAARVGTIPFSELFIGRRPTHCCEAILGHAIPQMVKKHKQKLPDPKIGAVISVSLNSR
jgi:hypothetical protein